MKKEIKILQEQVSHEENLLNSWIAGDLSLKPIHWDAFNQRDFIQGMKHALYIIQHPNEYL